jgi:hypothetical protein
MHKKEFGQAYYEYQAMRILRKFILYFSMLYPIFYVF